MALSPLKPHPIPDAALDAIVAKKAGAQHTPGKGIVERLLQMQRRVLVLDPLSVWWGIKSSADGKPPGFPIPVFGGPHAGRRRTSRVRYKTPCVTIRDFITEHPAYAEQRMVRGRGSALPLILRTESN